MTIINDGVPELDEIFGVNITRISILQPAISNSYLLFNFPFKFHVFLKKVRNYTFFISDVKPTDDIYNSNQLNARKISVKLYYRVHRAYNLINPYFKNYQFKISLDPLPYIYTFNI